ncbi:MAG: Adenylate kinase [Candidatus Roizmanbacteria bacterium GW2011_GWA2_36_23]|uniref:Adenylate kinase n=1 Tax=Candidatus Roizmanbacteria bacterium GW2011_GWA2_36_23 TaxID=1618480 RepID=A0A0G0GQU8_9BACT|nr:MAG: Adenylate kinase [Candidatus Roizmanbacteria bacterium GW2011_GWA2_36_23]
MKLVLIGIQGSGKSTQGNLLSKQLKIPYLSTGHIFRELAKEKTKSGRYIKEVINTGLLVPDERTISIVTEYLTRPEYKKGYILDGFPRTVNQAKEFQNNVDKVVYLKISQKDALWRLMNRNDIARDDETLPALKKRIEMFYKHTLPVVEYYEKQKKLVTIDGIATIENVNQEILKSFGWQYSQNKITRWKRDKRIILSVVGLPGAGKSAAAAFFKEKGFEIVEFGTIINHYIDKHHLDHTETNHKKVREDLRRKYGNDALAKLNEKKLHEVLKIRDTVVIDGLRSWEEYLYLKETFKQERIVILALYADKKIRYKRIIERGYRDHLYGEKRDIDELIGINMAPTIGFADYFIDANSSLTDLKDRLEIIYRIIYYS